MTSQRAWPALVSLWLLGRAVVANATLTTVQFGELAGNGAEEAQSQWGPTFEAFLNERHRIDATSRGEAVRWNFSMVALDSDELLARAEGLQPNKLDFSFANPSMSACLEAMHGARPILSLINKRQGREVSELGGTVVALQDSNISEYCDISEKVPRCRPRQPRRLFWLS